MPPVLCPLKSSFSLPGAARAALLTAVLLALPSYSFAAEHVGVRGGVHDENNRLVFDWPRNVPYKLDRDGGQVTLTFNAGADLDVATSARKLTRVQGLAAQQQDGKTVVTFNVDPNARVQNFLSGTYVVVDVAGAAAPPVVAAKADKKAEPPKGADNKPSKLEAKLPNGPALIVDTKEAAKPDAASVAVTMSAPLATFEVEGDSLPATLYSRAGETYLIFDHRVKLKAQPPGSGVAAPTVIDGGSYTAYRFSKVETPTLLKHEDNVWKLYQLPANSASLAAEIAPQTQPDYTLGSRMLLSLQEAGQVISFTDPVVGDTLYIVPTGVAQHLLSRRYADFDLLPTWQGVAIRAKNDALVVHRIAEGIELTLPGGMRLSDPRTAAMRQPKTATLPASKPASQQKLILDIDSWSHGDENFLNARRALMQQAVQAAPDARNTPRLDLARFYVARGNGMEGLSILEVIAGDDPSIVARPEFLALRGAAYVLAGEPDLGLDDFTRANVDGYNDIPLWKAVALALQHDDAGAAQQFSTCLGLLAAYPEPFFTRFSLLAVETLLDTGDNDTATKVLNNLAARSNGDAMRLPQVLYLRGVLQSRVGSMSDAEKLWQQATQSDDALASARARLALINLHFATHAIDAKQAALELERLRFAWRGDDIELSVLERLAQMYEVSGDREQALETLDRARRIFPNSTQDADLLAKQQQIFHDMFLGDPAAGATLSPLKMLAAYQHYKALLPADPVQKQAIVGKLVDQMLQMDLLSNAADLLATQVTDEIDPVKKAKLAARMAGIQLLNQDDAGAVKTLDASDNPALPGDVQAERRVLRARALADQSQQAQAVALLADDRTEAAHRLVATAFWQQKDWPHAAAALGDLQGDLIKEQSPATLNAEQAELIYNRALAMSLAGDQAGLSTLAGAFGPAMKHSAQADAFAFLTGSSDMGSAANLAAVQGQAKSVDMFQGVLESYRKQGGDAVAPAEAAPAAAPSPPVQP